MNRIILLLLLGVTAGVWVLRELGSLDSSRSFTQTTVAVNADLLSVRENAAPAVVMPGPVDRLSQAESIRPVSDSTFRSAVRSVRFADDNSPLQDANSSGAAVMPALVSTAEAPTAVAATAAVPAAAWEIASTDEPTAILAARTNVPAAVLTASTPPVANTSVDGAALGRWATSLIGSLVDKTTVAGKLSAAKAQPTQPSPLASSPATASTAPTPVSTATASSSSATKTTSDTKPAATTPAVDPVNPADMELPSVVAAAPEDVPPTDANAGAAARQSKRRNTATTALPAGAVTSSTESPGQSPVAKRTQESKEPASPSGSMAMAVTASNHRSDSASGAASSAPSIMPLPPAPDTQSAGTSPAAHPQPPLTPALAALSQNVHYALSMYQHQRLLNTGANVPWEVMHRFVAFGAATEVLRDGPGGEPVNAIGWLLWGGRCDAQPVLVLSGGQPTALVGVGVQGHPGQFLAMLAQSRIRPESPFTLEGQSFTVQNLIDQEKLDCASNIELTFELIAMSYYLKTDETWHARDGQEWSISRLVREEIQQPIHTAACGGSHRLFGLSAAVKKRVAEGQPVDGEFLRAQRYIRAYQAYTLSMLQNRDGSLSTDWFRRPADNGDLDRKIQTTGHMLEWLVFSLDESQLRDPRIYRSVDFLATQIIQHPNRAWSIGPFGHALHALALYDARVFSPNGPQFLQHRLAAPQIAARKDETAPQPKATADAAPFALSELQAAAKGHSAKQTTTPSDANADGVREAQRPSGRPASHPTVGTPDAAAATAELEGPDLGFTR